MRPLLFLLGLVLCACGPTEGAWSTAHRRSAILGGTVDAATTSVFLLDLRYDTGATGICSATLVSPRVLLTAAHCASPAVRGAATMTIRATNVPNDSMLQSSDFIDVTLFTRHPSWVASNQQVNDVAMLLLARAPAGVTPVPLRRTPPTVGLSARLVGYGRIASGDAASSGTRRSVASPITRVTSTDFDFGVAGTRGTCIGDSGGPAFVAGSGGEVVAGVHSSGSGQCGDGTDMRVDAFLSFIDGFITANDPPACTADGRCATGCATPDPDCAATCAADGRCATGCATPDPDCPAACTADGRCAAGCATPDPDCSADCGTNGVCASSCATPDVDCAGCVANQACVTGCATLDPDCLTDGDVCLDASACPGAQCLSDARGFSFCSRACGGDAECQRGMVCTGGVCRPPVEATETGVVGGCVAAPAVGSSGLAWWALVVLLLRRRCCARTAVR